MSSNIRIKRICKHCNSEFTAKTTVTKYCSDKCSKAAYKARKRGEKIKQSEKATSIIKQQPIEYLKAKDFLSIQEVCQLVGISKRTVYRLLERGKLSRLKIGSRTLIKHAEVNKLFEVQIPREEIPIIKAFDIAKCYTIGEAQEKYGVSEKALHTILKRNKVQKMKKGRYVYVQQQDIDKLFSYEKN